MPMKNLFTRKSGSTSPRLSPSPENRDQNRDQNRDETHENTPDHFDLPVSRNAYPSIQAVADADNATTYSVPLSEAETVTVPRDQGLNLQPTYQQNFDSYTPCLVRRQFGQRAIAEETATVAESDADDSTMISEPDIGAVMRRDVASYNHLRTLVVASERILNSMYVFPDMEAFELFRQQGKDRKVLKKSSRSGRNSSSSDDSGRRESIPNSESHSLQSRGTPKGVPLLRIEVPYMSAFRPKTPYMVFRKFLESTASHSDNESLKDEDFESFEFCTVHLKTFQHYKRYTFVFQPERGTEFRVLAFQHSYRPFTDFNYKDTRFRVFGTSRTVAYPTFYNPELKLYVLDEDQPSLMDCLVEKKDENRKQQQQLAEKDIKNPVPSSENPLIRSIMKDEYSSFYKNSVPHDLPPFGKFLDARSYAKHGPLVPKKYSELGKVAVYEDPLEMPNIGESSSSNVHLDSLVLTTIFLALRETSIRSTVKREDIETY